MLPVFNERDFDNQPLNCPRCHWKGNGSEAVIIDFYGITKMKEAHCPNCDANLARVKRENANRGESPDSVGYQIG
ncbi:MAG: hypothetical protein ICV51_04340 [Flavisolibacter sp.]|nr:hypothetical protein [Flavisolibacter sp.]MBD0351845.1 hypothetical protein [Flavisolibacter sp.]MBD0374840.1 hypothetical protein [Flavisolibacter sp.]